MDNSEKLAKLDRLDEDKQNKKTLFVGGLMSCICHLCLLAHSGVQHVLLYV
jgi:hypothetical protein